MDKLGRDVYKSNDLIYKYQGVVDTPPLEMIDDIISVSACGISSVTMNEEVNSFVEHNKHSLGKNKCAKIHVGNKSDLCPKLTVHEHEMKESVKEKYLSEIKEKNTES